MKSLLSQFTPEREYGARSQLLREALVREGLDRPGMALELGALSRWIQGGPLELMVRALYGGTELRFTEQEGWEDRRLVTEARFLMTELSEELTEFLDQVPLTLEEGPWIVAASAPQEEFSGARWRANTLAGLQQAVRLVLAESYSLQISAGFYPDAGLLILPDEQGATQPGPDPLCLEIEEARGLDLSYSFGRLYNRLLWPERLFEYLNLIAQPEENSLDRAWRNAALAAGYDPDFPDRVRSRLEAMNCPAEGEALPSPGSGTAPLYVRQLIGTPGAPGRQAGRIRFYGDDSPPGEEPVILVVHRWNRAAEGLSFPVAGLVEAGSGHGGIGTLAALKSRVPSISETRDTELLPLNARAMLDGDTGILTLLDLH